MSSPRTPARDKSRVTLSVAPPGNNHLLRGLPQPECRALFEKLRFVELHQLQVLQEANDPVQSVYFLNAGTVSVIAVMNNGDSAEIGMVGSEGLLGVSAIFGSGIAPHRELVHVPGSAFRVQANNLISSLASCPQLRRQIELYSQRLMVQVAQTAACRGSHELRPRLARWLLMTQDRVGSIPLPFTHEVLGAMLSTNRATVSLAAEGLRKAGAIAYKRGKIDIVNRASLEALACECYRLVQNYDSRLP